MAIASLNDFNVVNQDIDAARDGSMHRTREDEIRQFARGLIHDYGTFKINEGYSLHFEDLPYPIKKLFLKIFLDINFYLFYEENDLINEAIFENKDELNSYIKSQLDDVYHEVMDEMGFYLQRGRDNGDYLIQRRG